MAKKAWMFALKCASHPWFISASQQMWIGSLRANTLESASGEVLKTEEQVLTELQLVLARWGSQAIGRASKFKPMVERLTKWQWSQGRKVREKCGEFRVRDRKAENIERLECPLVDPHACSGYKKIHILTADSLLSSIGIRRLIWPASTSHYDAEQKNFILNIYFFIHKINIYKMF